MPALCPSIRYINLRTHLSKLQAVNHSSKRKQFTSSKQKLNIHVGETSLFAYKCDPILEKMVKGEEEKNEFFRVLIENAFKRRLNGFYKRLNEFQKR